MIAIKIESAIKYMVCVNTPFTSSLRYTFYISIENSYLIPDDVIDSIMMTRC